MVNAGQHRGTARLFFLRLSAHFAYRCPMLGYYGEVADVRPIPIQTVGMRQAFDAPCR